MITRAPIVQTFDDDVGIQQRIVPDRRIIADKHTGIERHPRANGDPVSEGDAGPDRDIGTDLSVNATSDRCGNSSRRGDGAKEGLGDLRKGECGIGNYDMGIGDLSKTPVGEECSGSGGPARLEHPIPCDEGQIVRACLFKARQACDRDLWRPHKFSADDVVDLCQ